MAIAENRPERRMMLLEIDEVTVGAPPKDTRF